MKLDSFEIGVLILIVALLALLVYDKVSYDREMDELEINERIALYEK